MIKVNMLTLLLLTTCACHAQNIYSALHLNENRDYKKARPNTISFVNDHQFPDDKTKFNEQGDIIESESRNPNGSVTNYAYEYTYDKYGNRTEQKIYKVTIRPNGKKKKEIDRIFKKEYIY